MIEAGYTASSWAWGALGQHVLLFLGEGSRPGYHRPEPALLSGRVGASWRLWLEAPEGSLPQRSQPCSLHCGSSGPGQEQSPESCRALSGRSVSKSWLRVLELFAPLLSWLSTLAMLAFGGGAVHVSKLILQHDLCATLIVT